MATLEDLQDTLLALMERVEQLERQLRSPAAQPKVAAPAPSAEPPAYEPELQQPDGLDW